MFCWGQCEHGQLGLGGVTDLEINCPKAVTSEIPITNDQLVNDVKTGDSHSVILTNDGKVLSCGSNEYGQVSFDVVFRLRKSNIFTSFSLVTKA